MDRANSPALRGTWLGTLLRLLNPVVRALLGSRLHWPLSRWFLLISWRGARTGRAYTTPVSYVLDGRDAYVTTGDRWQRNLVRDPSVRVRLAGRWRLGRATVIADVDESAREHARLFRERPFFRRLAGIPAAPEGGPDRQALDRSLRAGRTLLRIEL